MPSTQQSARLHPVHRLPGNWGTRGTVVLATSALLAAAACTSDPTNESTTPPSNQPTPTTGVTTPDASATPATAGTQITITAGDQTFHATLNDTQVAQDFARTLPVTLPWFRNAGIEYITELEAPLTETGPFYTDVQPGDLVYYNPRDSITIIYSETSSVPTLTKMGEITSDLGAFENLPDTVDMRIEAR